MIQKLVAAGMNVARVNFSHGTHQYHRTVIRRIQQVRKSIRKPVAILQDLQGPKIRIGLIKGGVVQLKTGQKYVLTGVPTLGDEHRASVSLRTMPNEVASGHSILLADGNIELRVERVVPPEIFCRVIVGGALSSHKGINLHVFNVNVDYFTRKARKELRVTLGEDEDEVA